MLTPAVLVSLVALFMAGGVVSYALQKFRSGGLPKQMLYIIVALAAAVVFFALRGLTAP